MNDSLKLRTFEIGTHRKRGEGLRIGTVRRVPQRVAKKDYARHDYFDVWFPTLSPSQELLDWVKAHDIQKNKKDWETFAGRYEREMVKQTDSRQALILLAEMAKLTAISIGCYCEDETCCHRSILLKLIKQAATARFQHAKK